MILAAALSFWQTTTPGTALVALGGLALYIASRAAADALAGGDPARAGRRAVGHCLPIAVVALMCLRPALGRPGIDPAGFGRPAVAVGLVFSTSVACLTLLLGIVTYLAPVTTLPPSRKIWPFVLPAALLALVAGFNGHLNAMHAGMLVVLGLAVLNLWRGIQAEQSPDVLPDNEQAPRKRIPPWTRRFQLALAIALAFVGAWATTRGVARLEQSSRILTGILLAGTVLGPLLTLPVLGTTARLAEHGHSDSAVTTLISIALINLCAVLPLVIFSNYAISLLAVDIRAPHLLESVLASVRPAPYPMVSWRVDTVMLVVIGFALIPWSMARWTFTRVESMALVIVYAVYLGLVTFFSTR